MSYLERVPTEILKEIIFEVDPVCLKSLHLNNFFLSLMTDKIFVKEYLEHNKILNHYVDNDGMILNAFKKEQLLGGIIVNLVFSGSIKYYCYTTKNSILLYLNDTLETVYNKCNNLLFSKGMPKKYGKIYSPIYLIFSTSFFGSHHKYAICCSPKYNTYYLTIVDNNTISCCEGFYGSYALAVENSSKKEKVTLSCNMKLGEFAVNGHRMLPAIQNIVIDYDCSR
jgi:hypothetical protein